jgi:peptide subunit release factor 1 (eRF1)
MNRQSRWNLVQLMHGDCLSHLSFRRRHSKQEVIKRFLRRILGCSLRVFFSEPAVFGEAALEVPVGGDGDEKASAITEAVLQPYVRKQLYRRHVEAVTDVAMHAIRTLQHDE